MRTRLLAATAALLLAFGVTACGSGAAEPSAAPASEGTEQPSPAPSTAADPEGADPAASAPEADDPYGPPSCLVGDWEASSAALQGWYSSFMGDTANVDQVNGTMHLSFSEDEFIMSMVDVEILFVVDGINAVAMVSGPVAGTWWSEGGGILTTTVEDDQSTAAVYVEGFTFTDEELGISLEPHGGFAGYECEPGFLRLETQAANGGTAYLGLEAL